MGLWRGRTKGWTAKFAAILFVCQMLLLGVSAGASAAPVPRDQFGNVLCIGGAEGHGGGERTGHHSSPLDCCKLGCNGMGGSLAPPPADVVLPLLHADLHLVFGVNEGLVRTVAALSAHRPRGPPPSLSI